MGLRVRIAAGGRRGLVMLALACSGLCTSGATGVTASGNDVIFISGDAVKIADAMGRGELRLPLRGYVRTAAVSPDGSLLAYCSLVVGVGKLDTIVGVADPRTGRTLWSVAGLDVFDRPVWAPDGRRFAFQDVDAVWLGGTKRHDLKLVSGSGNGGFAWSPDGSSLAVGTRAGLVVVDVRTGLRTVLVRGAAARSPAWASDGRDIAYIVGGKLYVVDVESREHSHALASRVGEAEWSPDARQLAYLTSDQLMFVISVRTKSGARLVGRDVLDLSWSPDSRFLAFSRRMPVHPSLFLVGRSGGSPTRLTAPNTPNGDRTPVWSPDGKRIAYVRSSRGTSRIYVVESNGRHERPILGDDLESQACACSLAWLGSNLRLLPPPRLVSFSAAKQVTTGSSISGGLAVDGHEAAALLNYGVGELWSAWETILWSPRDGAQVRAEVRCPGSNDNVTSDDVSGPVLSGDRYAFLCSEDMGETSLFVATTEQPQATAPLLAGGNISMAGADGLLVAIDDGKLIRIEPDGSQTMLRRYAFGTELVAVDGDRILVAPDRRSLQVLTADGADMTSVLPLPHAGGALLRGSAVITLDHGTLGVHSLDGATATERTLPAQAVLNDVYGDRLLYTLHFRLHLLRISDSRDVALHLPGQISYASGRFDADGALVAAYDTGDQRPGVLAYLPAGRVDALLTTTP